MVLDDNRRVNSDHVLKRSGRYLPSPLRSELLYRELGSEEGRVLEEAHRRSDPHLWVVLTVCTLARPSERRSTSGAEVVIAVGAVRTVTGIGFHFGSPLPEHFSGLYV
jgi:hypothetical protein